MEPIGGSYRAEKSTGIEGFQERRLPPSRKIERFTCIVAEEELLPPFGLRTRIPAEIRMIRCSPVFSFMLNNPAGCVFRLKLKWAIVERVP